MFEESFRPDERDAVNTLLREFPHGLDLDEWLRLWQLTVEGMRDGYGLSKWDYQNELDVRDIIDDAAALLGPESRSVLDEAVRPWDEEFRRWTVESDEWIEWLGEARIPSPQRWWWSRAPREVDPVEWTGVS